MNDLCTVGVFVVLYSFQEKYQTLTKGLLVEKRFVQHRNNALV